MKTDHNTPCIIVTVEFADQLAATNRPVDTLDEARRIVTNESEYGNTVQAYAWNSGTNRILYCLHGPSARTPHNTFQGAINIDTLVEDHRI